MRLHIKVTKIKDKWHARLFNNDIILDEMACSEKADIGWICRELLRWVDKLGRSTPWTKAARRRQQYSSRGKIWYGCRKL